MKKLFIGLILLASSNVHARSIELVELCGKPDIRPDIFCETTKHCGHKSLSLDGSNKEILLQGADESVWPKIDAAKDKKHICVKGLWFAVDQTLTVHEVLNK